MSSKVISRSAGVNFVFDRDVRPDIRVTIYVRNTRLDDVIKLVLATNDRPHIPSTDESIWRRVKIVPFNITVPEDPAYATVGGFVLDQLGFIPKGGESFEYGNHRFTVMEMDGKRVARVKIQWLRPAVDTKKAPVSAEAAGRETKVSKAT